MEGLIDIRLKKWIRREIKRLVEIVKEEIVKIIYGQKGKKEIMIIQKVVMRIKIKFEVIKMVILKEKKKKMGQMEEEKWVKLIEEIKEEIIVVMKMKIIYEFLKGENI